MDGEVQCDSLAFPAEPSCSHKVYYCLSFSGHAFPMPSIITLSSRASMRAAAPASIHCITLLPLASSHFPHVNHTRSFSFACWHFFGPLTHTNTRSVSCWSNYGSYPVHRPYCHEMAVRILLGCIETHASRCGFLLSCILKEAFHGIFAGLVFQSPPTRVPRHTPAGAVTTPHLQPLNKSNCYTWCQDSSVGDGFTALHSRTPSLCCLCWCLLNTLFVQLCTSKAATQTHRLYVRVCMHRYP